MRDGQGDENGGVEPVGRPVRADAQRNIRALLKTAMTVFATSGVNAPVREIAEQAGVGVGTVYRHFPTRADLIVAVFRQEVDACADAAPVLAAEYSRTRRCGDGSSVTSTSSAPSAGSQRRSIRAIRPMTSCPPTSRSDCGPRWKACSNRRRRRVASAPESTRMISCGRSPAFPRRPETRTPHFLSA